MQVTIVGEFFGSSGYANHTRQLANALNKFVEVKVITGLHPNWQREVTDAELEMINREDKNEIRLIITHPLLWRVNCTAKRNFVYCVWEGDKVPEYFVKEMENPDIERIILPSEHTRQAILKTFYGFQRDSIWEEIRGDVGYKLQVLPHGVNHEIFKPSEKEIPYKLEGDSCKAMDCKPKFTFIANKGLRNIYDRGGMQYTIQAYIEEFTDKDPVRLVIKINPAYGIPNIENILKELIPNIHERKDLPEITFDTLNYEYKELAKFYQSGDVFISSTRAEAFNLPVLEAMACGIPVITTAYGGQSEFSEGWPITFKLEEIKHELQYEGIKWATPDVKYLRELMRFAMNNKEKVKEQGILAEKKSQEYSWERTAKEIGSKMGVPNCL